MINIDNWTYGYEIEWGDIDRTIKIPESLGSWEYAETDIVNLYDPVKNIACDPLGLNPTYGGEINTKPTKTSKEQIDKILELYDFFIKNNNKPSSSCVNHGHLHIHIPELIKDINLLKKLTKYIMENQKLTVDACYKFYSLPIMKKLKNCTMYLKLDGGRLMPNFMCNNIINLSKNFNDFIKLQCAGKDGVSMGRPFRYAINTYCLKHTQTIEFRCFRSTTNRKQIEDQFKFAKNFLYHALTDGKPVFNILSEYNYNFPDFIFNENQYKGWIKTKYDKSRGEKKRKYIQI